MKITLQFYTMLKDCLPKGAEGNKAEIEIEDGATIQNIIERQNMPQKMINMVMVSGTYVAPSDFTSHELKDGDTLSMWPPLAGG